MLLDDSADYCEAAAVLLNLRGYVARYKRRGRELIDDLSQLRGVDFLCTDYYMPDMNGVQLITAVRAQFPDLPTAVVTGSKDESIAIALQRLPGRCHLLYKPLDFDDLCDIIDRDTGGPAPTAPPGVAPIGTAGAVGGPGG